jgi:hypothetical protein
VSKTGQEDIFFLCLIKHYRENVLRSGDVAPGSLMGGGVQKFATKLVRCSDMCETFCDFINITREHYFCKNFMKIFKGPILGHYFKYCDVSRLIVQQDIFCFNIIFLKDIAFTPENECFVCNSGRLKISSSYCI